MHTSSAVSKPSPKIPAAAADPDGQPAGAEGTEGGAANRFSDVIAKAGEQQEAAQQPSANDVLPVVPGIPLNLPPQAAGSIGARSDAPVGSKRLLPPDVRVGGDVAAGEGSRDTTAAAKASPDTTAAAQGSPDATALLTPPSGDSSRGVPVGDVKTGSRGSTEAAGGSTGQAAAVQAVPSSPNTLDGPAAVAAHAPPGKTGTPALDATPAATPAAATPAPAVTEAAPATTASTPTTTASATTAAATATTAAAAAAARPVPTAAGAEGSGADRGARLRRNAADAPPSERVESGGAGLKVETTVAAGSAPYPGSDPSTHPAGTAAFGAELQGAGGPIAAATAAPGNNGGASDASVFALTMNQPQASGTLAATRSEMIAEMTQSAIDVPVDHADFSEAFARQSASLVVQGSSSAEIRLTPQDMGPIRIAISLEADAVSLDMAAENAETRAAIEASMPALRQMLADQGVRLADWRLASEPGIERQQPTGGDTARRHGEQGPGNGDGSAMQQPAGDPASNAGNGFANSRGTSQFNRHGSGWAPDAATAGGSGMSGDHAGVGTGSGRLDLYA
ncbi:MAG TPA: flagellar hook-length control protein FliK [Lautropia sp.]|nr:flagellar hook-length control protein FliK [Lautropia sp.]